MSEASPVALVVKNPPASAAEVGDTSLIPGLVSSPRGKNGNPLQYSCLESPVAAEPGGLQSMGSQRVGYDWAAKHEYEYGPNIASDILVLKYY